MRNKNKYFLQINSSCKKYLLKTNVNEILFLWDHLNVLNVRLKELFTSLLLFKSLVVKNHVKIEFGKIHFK